MQQTQETLATLKKEIADALTFLKLDEKEAKMHALEVAMNAPDFWSNQAQASQVSKEHGHLKQTIEKWRELEQNVNDATELLDMVNEVDNEEECKELKQNARNFQSQFEALQIQLYLSGKYDAYPALISFHAGAGGTDAQDFAEMLMRMYVRYAESKEWKVEIQEKSDGDEAGIKSATMRIDGEFTYGFLKEESGVHRLVRLSPFNSGNTRETSFVKVEVVPEINHDEVEIDEKDLRIDVYRSSGKGGQSVNTTDSAVRITHIPTGLTAQCQNERSQLQNKQNAMKALLAKLIALQEKNELSELSELKGGHVDNAFGSQIRSYVLHPYQMVKDHRTNHETSQVDKVLEGDPNEIDLFIEKSLKKIQ